MKVLFLDQFSESGGAQLCLRDVLREAKQRGWEAAVMAPGRGPLLQFAETLGYQTGELPLSGYSNGGKSAPDFLRYPAQILRSRFLIRRQRCDLIYVNGPRALPAVARLSTPLLFHSHNLLDKKYAQALVRWSFGNRNAKVIACSGFIAASLKSYLKCSVKVIYNGVPDCGFVSRVGRNAPLCVGMLGRISPEKGHLDFVKAARELKARQRIRFIVIGAALFSDPAYERSVRECGAESGVEFHGWTADPAAALRRLDILAVPSTAVEASPRVIMEALSAGTVVVAYPAGGIPELIRNGHDGVLTEACSSASLAKCIEMLAANPQLRCSLAENGRKSWQSRFTVERFQREVCEEMKALSASAPRSGSPVEPCADDATSALP